MSQRYLLISQSNLILLAVIHTLLLILQHTASLHVPPSPNKHQIYRVKSKDRALDVLVFRNVSQSVEEFLLDRENQHYPLDSDKEKTLNFVTEKTWKIRSREEEKSIALDILMKGYEQTLTDKTPHGPTVQFYVKVDDDRFDRANGIVGSIDVQVRRDNFPYEEVQSPYLHVKNFLVDERMRRRGIGGALLERVFEYAKSKMEDQKVSCILLGVDRRNLDAIRIYERAGFFSLEDSEVPLETGVYVPMLKTLDKY